MNHNKNYFLVYLNVVVVNDGTGFVINDLSLRYILGQLYDKFNAFSLKLEGFVARTASSAVITDDMLLFHVDGLPFMNGFDTCPNYRSSRVVEMIDYATIGNNGYNFISNCNGVNFWKPSTEKINFKIFHTRLTDETIIINPDDVAYIFSITGLSAYKTIHPTRDIVIPRFPAMRTSNLTLSSYKGVSIDARNRAFRFSQVNLRHVIGPDYDRYKKFALVTKYYASVDWNGSGYPGSFSGFGMGQMLISGFDWFRPSTAQYSAKGTQAQQLEIATIHPTPSCVACQVVYGNSTVPRAFKETYIENVFEKSQAVVDIIISQTQIFGYMLVPFNTNNTQLFPHFTLNFDIIPLNEY